MQRGTGRFGRGPNPESVIYFRTLGGAIAHVGSDDSAFAHRSAAFNLSIGATWFDPTLDSAAIGWARATWEAIQPFSTGGVYVNFAGFGDDADRQALLGENLERLEHVRQAYDPHGLFDVAARRP